MLAQLARAIQAVHSRVGLHRDVKGGNVLVRRGDGRAVLIDLGSSLYVGAATLTPPQVQPGTPAYQAPEAGLFALQFMREPTARYVPRPSDDLYALGVTACRLVTGEYPEPAEPEKDEQGDWHLKGLVLPPALLEHPRVEPELRACILRMLSERPEERGSVEEMAEALERAAGMSVSSASPERANPPRPRQPWRRYLAVAVSVALVTTGAWWAATALSGEKSSTNGQPQAAGVSPEDAGPTGLGDAAARNSSSAPLSPHAPEALAEEPLPTPQPGQARPDADGRCSRKRPVALNGGCWRVTDWEGEECAETIGSAGLVPINWKYGRGTNRLVPRAQSSAVDFQPRFSDGGSS